MMPVKKNIVELLQTAVGHHQAGRVQQAEQIYRKILAAEPDNADANHLLGLLAYQVGKFEIAVNLITKAVQRDPRQCIFYNNLGNALKANNNLDGALASYKKALALKPDYGDAHYNMGNALMELKQPSGALSSYKKAISLEPDFAEAHYNLGNAFRENGNLNDAVAAYERALAIKADFVEAYYNLGNVFLEMGQLDQAEESLRKSLGFKPENAEAHNNLGRVLRERGNLSEAITCYRKALTLNPGYVESLNNLGNALRERGDLTGAIANYRQALTVDPDRAETYSNLGYTLHEAGLLSEAVGILHKGIDIKPDYAAACSNLLFALNYDAEASREGIYKQSLQWGDSLLQNFQADDLAYANSRDKNKRLRIGYLSPDFRDHSVAYFIEPVLKKHNRDVVEIFCYANVRSPDAVTGRMRGLADHWRSVVRQSDAEIIEQIKNDNIDILVDLAGHTGENRLPVFAMKPAPVQVSWIGYPNTTGLRTMDYRLTDVIADPPGDADRLHSEKLIRLEHGFLSYLPDAAAPGVGPLPCLTHDHITFGSFNNLAKVRPEVIKVWSTILHAVPHSRLLLKAKQLRDNDIGKRYMQMFIAEGITPERIKLYGMLPKKEDHLGLYNRIDIGLDPFPYNGTTTTCEALWMGVPVITLLGDRHAGRVGASLLHRIGLDELVAASVAEYVDIARALSQDPKRLQGIRARLRGMMQESELMDSRLFTSHLEEVYRQMWIKWCDR